jgi:diguanylate cyclase (GGDEF)-like protein
MQLLSIPCIAMALVNFYVGTYYFYFYSKRRQIREHLPFALLCLSVGLYDVFSAGLYNSLSIDSGVFWQRLQLDTGIVISIFLIWFTSVFIQQDRNRIIQLSIAGFIVILIASFFAGPELTLSPIYPAIKNVHLFNLLSITYYEGVVGLVYQVEIFSILILYLYFIYLFIRQYQKIKSRSLFILLACLTIYFFAVVSDSLVAMRYYSFIYISEYSFFFIILAMAYTLLDRFVNLYSAFEELNVNLEQKVHDRTREVNDLNENLKRLADRDGLTGVYNRRFFNEYFDIEVRRAMNFLEHRAQLQPNQDNDMNFGLAMIDIDHFKIINDTCGHLAGDSVLKQVIEIIERNIFSRDVICRYGGDEFALLLTKTSKSGILQAAEKIRKEIDEHVFFFDADHECQHVAISVGLVTFDEVLEKGSEEILRLADDRLLRAKDNGRNRIVFEDDK